MSENSGFSVIYRLLENNVNNICKITLNSAKKAIKMALFSESAVFSDFCWICKEFFPREMKCCIMKVA